MKLTLMIFRRVNWENQGIELTVDSQGRYAVSETELGIRRDVKRGRLTAVEHNALRNKIREAKYCESEIHSTPQPAQGTDWLVYQVRLRDERASKRIEIYTLHSHTPSALAAATEVILRSSSDW